MSQSPYTINPALTALAVDFARTNGQNRGFIADQVVPRVRVDDPIFKYTTYPLEEAFTVYDTQAGRKGNLNEIEQTGAQATATVLDYGLTSQVPYRDELAARNQKMPIGPRARAAYDVVDKVQLAREVRAASLLFSAGNYATGYKSTLSSTGQWSSYTSGAWDADPVADVIAAEEAMLVKPNVAVMGEQVFNVLRRQGKVSVALGGSQNSGRLSTKEELAAILGVERIIVGSGLQQTNKRGQTLATSRVWGKHLALLNIPTIGGDGLVANPDTPAFALTFQWNDKVAGENQIPAGKMGLYGGVEVYAGESLVEAIIAQQAGYLFTNAVA